MLASVRRLPGWDGSGYGRRFDPGCVSAGVAHWNWNINNISFSDTTFGARKLLYRIVVGAGILDFWRRGNNDLASVRNWNSHRSAIHK